MIYRDNENRERLVERAWQFYLILGVLAIGAYFLLPDIAGYPIRFLLLTSALAAIVVGLRLHRPRRPLQWYLFALALLMAILAAGTYIYYEGILGIKTPYPSPADAFFIVSYLFAAAGLFVIQRRTLIQSHVSAVEPIIVTIGVGLLAWVFLMKPYAENLSLSLLERAVSISYPLMDILLLAFTIRLILLPGARPAAYYFLIIGLFSTLIFDAVSGATILAGTYEVGQFIDAFEMLFFVFFGVAALHPSMSALSDVVLLPEPRLTWRRLALLAIAALMAPGVLVLEQIRGQSIDVGLISIASGSLFLLVLARMYGIIRDRERANESERILRRTAAALLSAPDSERICNVATRAVAELLSARNLTPTAKIGIALGSSEYVTVRDTTNDPARRNSGIRIFLDQYPDEVRSALLGGGSVVADRLFIEGEPDALVCADFDRERALFVPLLVSNKFWGVIFIAHSFAPSDDKRATLEALGREVALALESRALEEEFHLHKGEERFRSLIQNSSDVVAIVSIDGTIQYVSPAVDRVLGYAPDRGVGHRIFTPAIMHPEDIEEVRYTFSQLIRIPAATSRLGFRLRHAEGKWVHVEAVAKNMLDDPNIEGIVINYRDITERKSLEERLRHQAFHDPLTSLPNRALFMDRLQRSLIRSSSAGSGEHTAVLFLDLDNFKLLNDSLGHEAGDQILISVAKRLQSCLKAEDTPARFGGDEFCILLENVRNQDEAMQVADQVEWSLSTPFTIENRQIFMNSSIGIALSSADCKNSSDLLRNADIALYNAKESGKATHRVFDETMSGLATERLNLEGELRRAVEQKQFVVYYQPQFELLTGRIVGLEALVRWQHPERGLIAPQIFLPLAEDTSLISEMSKQVIEEACTQVQRWKGQSYIDVRTEISVNISARQFHTPEELVTDIKFALGKTGLPPDQLVLEITESTIMQDVDHNLALLRDLKNLGVQIAIDDFGTGYSNLAYLKNFPVDILKVDRSFVTGLESSVEDRSIVQAIISLTRALSLKVIAEGIETTGQMEELMTLGCELGQGYYFSKPLSAEQTTAHLAERLRTPFSNGN